MLIRRIGSSIAELDRKPTMAKFRFQQLWQKKSPQVGDDVTLWLDAYRIKPTLVAILVFLYGFLGVVALHSPVGDIVQTKFEDWIVFDLRAKLARSPVQSEKLKIYGLDDKTFAKLKRGTFTTLEWARLINGYSKSGAKQIVIDGLMSAAPDGDEASREEAKRLLAEASRRSQLIVGSFSSAGIDPVKGRTLLDLQGYEKYKDPHTSVEETVLWKGVLGSIQMSRQQTHAYGPEPFYKPFISSIGHIQLFTDNEIEPFLKIRQKAADGEYKITMIPHIGLTVADKLKMTPLNLIVNEQSIVLNRKGSIAVNFIHPNQIKVKSILNTFEMAQADSPILGVEPGDTVLIMPQYFTGHTDFRPSPFGLVAGGYYIAGILNSVLTGRWIQSMHLGGIFIVISGILVFVATLTASVLVYWSMIAGYVLLIAVLAILMFVYGDIQTPWIMPILTTIVTASHLFVVKTRAHERKVAVLKEALDGAIDPKRLEQLLANPNNIGLEPRERIVTLMFIDIVGFSLAAENMLPRFAFDALKNLLAELSKIVHKHNGVVDKSLGDGMLCYFGFDFDSQTTSVDHAADAARCAVEIQRESLRLNAERLSHGEVAFPLRIGVNTASCYLGNLGDHRRIEFTVVGNGVNFAKRLESGSEVFCIMLGESTYELIKGVPLEDTSIVHKMIHVKHHRSMVDAYHLDPCVSMREVRKTILESFDDRMNLVRSGERIQVSDRQRFRILIGTDAFGTLQNVSGTGLSANVSHELVIGSKQIITLSIFANSNDAKASFEKSFMVTVRWCYATRGEYIVGFSFDLMDLKEGGALVEDVIGWLNHAA